MVDPGRDKTKQLVDLLSHLQLANESLTFFHTFNSVSRLLTNFSLFFVTSLVTN